jgi:hypothetical protein
MSARSLVLAFSAPAICLLKSWRVGRGVRRVSIRPVVAGRCSDVPSVV